MELDVRIAHAGARADEAAGLEMIGGAEAAPARKPVKADPGARNEARAAVERDRLLRGDLEIELEMVLQVLADARPVGDDVDPERANSAAGPIPESFRSCGELIAPPQRTTSRLAFARRVTHAAAIVDAGRTAAVEGDAGRERMGEDHRGSAASSPASDRRWRSTSARRPSPSCRTSRIPPAARR